MNLHRQTIWLEKRRIMIARELVRGARFRSALSLVNGALPRDPSLGARKRRLNSILPSADT